MVLFTCSQLREARGLHAEFRSVPLRFDEEAHAFELDEAALAEARCRAARGVWPGAVLLRWLSSSGAHEWMQRSRPKDHGEGL